MKQRSVFAVAFVLLLMSSVALAQVNGRTEKFKVPFTDTGYFVGQCANFNVLTDFAGIYSGTLVYDKSGSVVQIIQHIRLIGESIYYNSTDPTKSVLGGPGEREMDRIITETGLQYTSGPLFKIRIPGYGLIFAETGHFVFDTATGQFLFNSGHNQIVDQDLAALCDYLK